MGCHSLLLAEIQAMMQGDDAVNGRGEEVPKVGNPWLPLALDRVDKVLDSKPRLGATGTRTRDWSR